MKYRKRPIVIEAVQWTGGNADEVAYMYDGIGTVTVYTEEIESVLEIVTALGTISLKLDDFIVFGDAHPCNPDKFSATYEAVEE